MNIAPIIRQSLDLWNNPSFTELSVDAIVDSANRCFSRHSLDLDLTSDAAFYSARSDIFTFPDADTREIILSGIPLDDVSRIIRVEVRGDNSTREDDWGSVNVVSYDSWDEALDRYGDSVAFYSSSDGLVMVSNRDGSRLDYRIVYKALRNAITAPDAVADIPGVYENLFVYDLALEFGEMIDNRSAEFANIKKTKMPYLMDRLRDEYDRIEKWRKNQKQSGPTYRRAFNDRIPGVRLGPRKFTVRF
jgi:hypothetical protein